MVLRGRAGYEENRRLSFWLSFDPDAQTVKYGKGHHMEARPAAAAPAQQFTLHCVCCEVICKRMHEVLGAVPGLCSRQLGLEVSWCDVCRAGEHAAAAHLHLRPCGPMPSAYYVAGCSFLFIYVV